MDGLIDKVDGSTEMFLERKYEIMRWLDTSMACRQRREQHVGTKTHIDIAVDDAMNMALSALNII